MEKKRVTLIPGDGIGEEISRAAVQIVEAAGGQFEWLPAVAGTTAVKHGKDPLPAETLDSITDTGLALKGPLETPIGSGFRSCNVALRKHFDLFANVRPAKTIDGVPSRYENVDILMVRENTEGLYAGIEHYIDTRRSAAESICVITRYSSERVIRFAFEQARKTGRKKVTLVHKANILKMSNGLFLESGKKIAADYNDIEFDDLIVDATAMRLVTNPERFDVIVTMNLFGDILSDLTAGLVGGLGVAPGANIGADGSAIFEAVHGTAPDIAGKGIANPTAITLAAAMMAEHVGQTDVASKMRKALFATLANSDTRTGDLGGSLNTTQFTESVIGNIK